jgi:hypothetical protein
MRTPEAERFGDVVVGAALQALDRVRLGGLRGQHDDRRLEALGPQAPADLAPVEVGQAHVEEHGPRRTRPRPTQRLLAGPRLPHGEALVQRELLRQLAAQRHVVVDNQKRVARRHFLTSFADPDGAGLWRAGTSLVKAGRAPR